MLAFGAENFVCKGLPKDMSYEKKTQKIILINLAICWSFQQYIRYMHIMVAIYPNHVSGCCNQYLFFAQRAMNVCHKEL